MKIKLMKLAQALPDSAGNTLDSSAYDMSFDGGYFTITPLKGKHAGTAILVFSANVAYAIPEKTEKKSK